MTKYDVIIFDADGTIIDSELGITKGVQYGLEKIGIIDDNIEKLKLFIGPPMIDAYMEVYGLSLEEATIAMGYSREYYSEIGLFESEVFSGIKELLESLKDKKRIMLATAKPIHFTERTLTYYDLNHYFEVIEASPAIGNEDMKSKIIKRVLDRFPDLDKSKVVMIGDREHDIIGAYENQIDSIAVTYGSGSIDELTECNPTTIVHSVEELTALLIG